MLCYRAVRFALIFFVFIVDFASASEAPLVEPRNVIVLIGDGMGPEHLTAARAYLGRALCVDSIVHDGLVTTHNVSGAITDSAAAGTAIATGNKVNNGVISQALPGDGSDLQTLLEYFKAKGRKTGLVTTTYMTDATPASFGAHEPSRSNTSQIASDFINQSKPNVLLGGGGSGMSSAAATAAGYTVVTTAAALSAIDSASSTLLSGQFGSGNLPYEYDGLGTLPHLSDMANKALSILELSPDGFFLMIEGGLIDKAAHSNNLPRTVMETVEFEDTVQQVLNWADGRTDTLVIITADHETGGLQVLQDNGAGQMPTVSWSSTNHTNANVPIYAVGYGAEQVSGILDNTDIFEIITRAGYTYNTAPQVDAGEDQLIEDGTSATLTGIVVDDGLSEPLGTVTAAWSKTSGPGTVQFADASAASTSAQFSAIGTYVLTLSADDGLLTGTDQIEITVAIRTSCGVGEPETDSDGDSTPDCIDACPDDALKIEPGVCGCGVTETALDSDNDGLADCVDADDDNDSVSDAQEYLDHTDPFDRGSNLVLLPATVCAEWNGFLGGMWNIMEHINLSHAALAVSSTLYDMNDLPDGSRVFSVPTGGQTDLIVHDMPGFEPNRYGKVCSSVNSAQPGDFDGRMVYYKPSPGSGTANTFDFAFAMPFLSGVKGRQFVLFNTFQPSLDSGDRRHRVANWIQLTNLSDHAQSGDLVFYSQSGAFLGSEETDLLAGARKDFSAHQFGQNRVGLIEWQPQDETALFLLRNVRYYYDNANWEESFKSAQPLEGQAGSGRPLALPLDTTGGSAIIELANTTDSTQAVSFSLYDDEGDMLDSGTLTLGAHRTHHLITDAILAGKKGIAVVQGSTTGGLIAVAMHYGRTPSGGIRYIYGLSAKEPLGQTLRSSYNTFLEQGCRLLLVNPSPASAGALLTITRDDGTELVAGEALSVAAHGLLDLDLCGNDAADNYGVVTVQAQTANTLTGAVLRLGKNDQYRFPTPLRQ